MKTANEIREAFIQFWTERGHAIIPNASLVPVNDPSLLFVNSGMFPLVPYLSGQPHPLGKRLCNFQRSIRTMWEDMEEIGDTRHTTCFNMMGNWSLGDYFKKEQLPWFMELYVENFGLDPNKIYVSVFKGNEYAPRDEESIQLWKGIFKKYGIDALETDNPQDVQKNYDKDGTLIKGSTYRIFTYDGKKNWWQRGEAPGELGGPTSEMFYDCGAEVPEKYKVSLNINDDSGKFIEVGNSVFMEFYLDNNMNWKKLPQKNVDFGGGFERVVFCSQEKSDIFDTELYLPAIEVIEEMTGKKYHKIGEEKRKPYRVIVDHIRAATFILGDDVIPSNKDQGYILRRFIRRAINFGKKLKLESGFTAKVADKFIDILGSIDDYKFLLDKRDFVKNELTKEEEKFEKTIIKGVKEVES
ncbi:alanine--tRNA ligase, partial [Candidatus Dojkabacteria bacterium]|nr:alanine--tRNA ligase [Candidatus Dojkabacteria bacterium]